MANRLKMAQQKAIEVLYGKGWSQRRIARELGVNRETVGRYVRQSEQECRAAEDSKPAISITGSEGSKPAISIAESTGRQSLCEPFREVIVGGLEQGLSAQRIKNRGQVIY